MEIYIKSFLEQLSQLPIIPVLLFLFVSGFLQVILPPYPGELILVFSGYLGTCGIYNWGISLFFAYWLSIIISNFLLYELGLRKGEKLLNSRFVSKLIPPVAREKAGRKMAKFGIPMLVAAIFIPGMYLPVVFFCGTSGCKRKLAYTGMVISTLAHDIMLYVTGGLIGNNWNKIQQFLTTYNRVLIGITILGVLSYCTYRVYNSFKKNTQKA